MRRLVIGVAVVVAGLAWADVRTGVYLTTEDLDRARALAWHRVGHVWGLAVALLVLARCVETIHELLTRRA